jgi:hypothetical protein
MAGIAILGLCITQAQPSAFDKKIQLTRSLSLLYFMLSNILYGFEQLITLFDLALANSPAELGIPAHHRLQPSAQPDLTCVLPSPPAQPPRPIKRQPRASPFCIAGPRTPPQTLFPHSRLHRLHPISPVQQSTAVAMPPASSPCTARPSCLQGQAPEPLRPCCYS